MDQPIAIHWYRRDLRIDDNASLYHALQSGYKVLPIFIFDKNILADLENKNDKRVSFIYDQVQRLKHELELIGSSLLVLYGLPIQVFDEIIMDYPITAVYTNHDYETYAQNRDTTIAAFLASKQITFHSYKDQVIFERDEITKDNNEPYTVFTPYSKKWKQKLNNFYLKPYPTEKYIDALFRSKSSSLFELNYMGFEYENYEATSTTLNETIALNYDKTRNLPGCEGTTKLSVHLRFGTISIRKLAAQAMALNETLLNELIWREFFMMILWHFPQTVSNCFKPQYDNIQWRKNEVDFKAWCNGQTGYPMVDAGMRQLNTTGWMHNRVRMVVASFLCKHLLIDWRQGEAYFAKKLLDYDLAQNVGNWQWAAGSGVDAAPYFRIFNPRLQQEKFDPKNMYVNKWVPEWQTLQYSQPIVQHEAARSRCLKVYKQGLNK